MRGPRELAGGAAAGGALALLLLLSGACAPEPARPSGDPLAPAPPRAGRFGSLRDFVLFERPRRPPGARAATWFFVDRFEVTRGDWAEFAATQDGAAVRAGEAALAGDPALPVARIDLGQARAFARWRFARLPRAEEWSIAAVGDGRNRFPWGSKEDATRTNTGELGLGEATPVGTFESGRRAEGWPYDLIGNVSEWTETVPWSWCSEDRDPDAGFGSLPRGRTMAAATRRALRASGLAVWQGVGGMLPPMFAVAAGGDDVPREVVGADFLTWMTEQTESVLAGDRRLRTGLRLYTTPAELLRALLAAAMQPTASDLLQLQHFVARGRHAEVLRAVWPAVCAAAEPQALQRPLGRWLAEHLAPEPDRGG